MRPIDDPSFLTPDERFAEVARILAAGVLRLHGCWLLCILVIWAGNASYCV